MAFVFNPHRNLVGQHALLSASKYHWTRYDDEKFIASYNTAMAAERGTKLHDFAANAIKLGVKLSGNSTLAMYVNDAIRYGMTPEQPLYYSENCFGTADAIVFNKNKLRIHDLKTGEGPTSIIQLRIYAALFCLEYGVKPESIQILLTIYQKGEKIEEEADPLEIRKIMDTIIHFDKMIFDMKRGVNL